ncbi:MAG: sterol desaturase family protein [Bryobacteraceae bacterium]
MFRRGFLQDAAYLVFYGEYFGVILGTLSLYAVSALDKSLDAAGVKALAYLRIVDGQPLWLQVPLLLLVFDFLQWLIHNLLHRVGWLWEFHKLHHSIEEMDWIGNWRFHWMEVVVYRSLLYIPAAFFGFSPIAMFAYGLLNTLAGHFAHSNLRIRIGWLRYLVNSPEMHRWHHAHPDAGPMNRNFGITLSVWDWLFGTAHLPENEDPARLGFAGLDTYPQGIAGRMFAPLRRRLP